MEKMTLEDLIDELAVFLDNCKATPFSAGKVSVPKEEFLAQLEELKMEIPSEVERSREIVARKEMIIAEVNRVFNLFDWKTYCQDGEWHWLPQNGVTYPLIFQ